MKQQNLSATVAVIAVGIITACLTIRVPQLFGEDSERSDGSLSASQPANSTKKTNPDRDPFSTSATMHELAGQAAPAETRPSVAPARPKKLPALTMRGFMDDGIRPPLVLLEVEDTHVYLVRQGDRMHIPSKAGVLELSIQKISKSGVRVEIVGAGNMIVHR